MSGARMGRDILSRGTNRSREDTHDQDNVTLVPSILDDADGALPTEEIPLSLWHPSRVFDRASSPLPGGQICGLQPFLLVELVPHGSPHRSWIKPPTSSVATALGQMRRLPLGIHPSAQRSRRADRSEHCVTFCGEPWSADLHYGSMGSLGLHSQSLVGRCQLSREGWRSV